MSKPSSSSSSFKGSCCSACLTARVTVNDRLVNYILLDRLITAFPKSAHHIQLNQRVCERCASHARRESFVPLPPLDDRPVSRGKSGKKIESVPFHPDLCETCISSKAPSTSSQLDTPSSSSKPSVTSHHTTFVTELRSLSIDPNYDPGVSLHNPYHLRTMSSPLPVRFESSSTPTTVSTTSSSSPPSVLTSPSHRNETKTEMNRSRVERATRVERGSDSSLSSSSGIVQQGAQGDGRPPLTHLPLPVLVSSTPLIRILLSSKKDVTFQRILKLLVDWGYDVQYSRGPDVPKSVVGFDYVLIGHDWIDYLPVTAAHVSEYVEWFKEWERVIEAAGMRDRVYPRLDQITYIVSKQYQFDILDLMPASTRLMNISSSSNPPDYEPMWKDINTIVDSIAAGKEKVEGAVRIRRKAGYASKEVDVANNIWDTGVKCSDGVKVSGRLRADARTSMEAYIGMQLWRGVGHICFQEQLHYYRAGEIRFLCVGDQLMERSTGIDMSSDDFTQVRGILGAVVEKVWKSDPPLYWRLDLVRHRDAGAWYVGEIELCGAEYYHTGAGAEKYTYIDWIADVLRKQFFTKKHC